MPKTGEYFDPTQLFNFLAVFPLIRKTVKYYTKNKDSGEQEDIVQNVKLGLLIWKKNRPRQELNSIEWEKIAYRATRNEIKDNQKKNRIQTISLAEMDEAELSICAKEKNLTTQLEGNTNMELHLLMTQMWGVIKDQSFLENYALLLRNDELTLHLIVHRGCQSAEMSKQLQLTETELDDIIELTPLSDAKISEFLVERFEMKATPAAIRKARQRATDQLHAVIKGNRTKKKNDQPSEYGKT